MLAAPLTHEGLVSPLRCSLDSLHSSVETPVPWLGSDGGHEPQAVCDYFLKYLPIYLFRDRTALKPDPPLSTF